MFKNFILSLLLCFALSGAANAFNSTFHVDGVGGLSCAEWQKIEDDTGMQNIIFSWASGFLSAINLSLLNSQAPQKNNDFYNKEYVLTKVSNYCSSNDANAGVWWAIFNAIESLPNK